MKRYLVTGGAGFIGSAVVRRLVRETPHAVLVLDKLTYAGNLDSLAPVAADPRYRFVQADIADAERVSEIMTSFAPDVILHLQEHGYLRGGAPAKMRSRDAETSPGAEYPRRAKRS